MLSQNMGRKRNSGRVLFLSFLIASLRTIFVVWLLLVWDRVLCQNQCTEVAEKWDFFFFHCTIDPGEKKIPKSFQHKAAKKIPKPCQLGNRYKALARRTKIVRFCSKGMTRSSKNVAENDPGNQWKQSTARRKK